MLPRVEGVGSLTRPALAAALTFALGSPAAGWAHAEIESCEPPTDATVGLAPERLVCTASENMDAKRSFLRVFDRVGGRVDNDDSQVDPKDRKTISVSLATAKMRDGTYTVKWKTLSDDDGDEASGQFELTVRR